MSKLRTAFQNPPMNGSPAQNPQGVLPRNAGPANLAGRPAIEPRRGVSLKERLDAKLGTDRTVPGGLREAFEAGEASARYSSMHAPADMRNVRLEPLPPELEADLREPKSVYDRERLSDGFSTVATSCR